MKNYDTVGRIKRGIVKQLGVEFDHLPPSLQRRIGGTISRTKRTFRRVDSDIERRRPLGRDHAKRFLAGKANSFVDYVDGMTRVKKAPSVKKTSSRNSRSKRTPSKRLSKRTRRRRVVGRK